MLITINIDKSLRVIYLLALWDLFGAAKIASEDFQVIMRELAFIYIALA